MYVNQDGIQFNAPAVFDKLIHEGEMPVVIGVFVMHGRVKAPSDKAIDRFNRSYEYDGLGDNYARFLLDELLPEVEKKTAADGRPIRLSSDGNDRAIGGSSSGAICAFTAAWERPDAFRRVFSAIGTYVGLAGRQRISDADPQDRAEADPHLPPGRQQRPEHLCRRLVDGQPGDGAGPHLRRLRGGPRLGRRDVFAPADASAVLGDEPKSWS